MNALPERLTSKIMPVTESGCWIWMGAHYRDGYGMTTLNSKHCAAHRAIWTIINGPIPLGLQLDHLCRVRPCVNPNHLEIVTQKENILRGTSRSALNAIKTHCVKGHSFTPDNTYQQRIGLRIQRSCKQCRRQAFRDWYDRSKHGVIPPR